jgi:hypothetical protein
MQRNPLQADAAATQGVFQRGREMQSGRGRRDRAFARREHGLVVAHVALVGGALRGDIGRQRRTAEIGDRLVERRAMKGERQRHLAFAALVLDFGVEMTEQADPAFIAEPDPVAGRELLRRLDQRLPARTIKTLDQGRLDLRLGLAADTAPLKLGRDHPRVVDDELVARLQPFGKIRNDRVAQHAVALHDQHARGIAGACRAQRDAGCGKLEIEEIGAHAFWPQLSKLRFTIGRRRSRSQIRPGSLLRPLHHTIACGSGGSGNGTSPLSSL